MSPIDNLTGKLGVPDLLKKILLLFLPRSVPQIRVITPVLLQGGKNFEVGLIIRLIMKWNELNLFPGNRWFYADCYLVSYYCLPSLIGGVPVMHTGSY